MVGYTHLMGGFLKKLEPDHICCNVIFNFTTMLLSFYVCNQL